jgi:hypothetical protein
VVVRWPCRLRPELGCRDPWVDLAVGAAAGPANPDVHVLPTFCGAAGVPSIRCPDLGFAAVVALMCGDPTGQPTGAGSDGPAPPGLNHPREDWPSSVTAFWIVSRATAHRRAYSATGRASRPRRLRASDPRAPRRLAPCQRRHPSRPDGRHRDDPVRREHQRLRRSDHASASPLPRLPAIRGTAWSGNAPGWAEFRHRLADHAAIWRDRGLRFFASTEIPWPPATR